ncbi:MAG: tetratricopeptide repeat protein, partial [Flavobacteriia bacterium]|nr:tetratricopeptide repeat protein [Flavobacteriia bacterium]
DAIMQDSYNNRGLAKIYLKEYTSAIEDYNKAIELDPYDARVFTNRGDAKQYQGKITDACMDWKKAQELGDPNNDEKIKKLCE